MLLGLIHQPRRHPQRSTVKIHNRKAVIPLAELEFSNKLSVDNLVGKTFLDRTDIWMDLSSAVTPEEVVQSGKIVDLTSKMAADGKLTWDVPAGDWTILRIGYTPNDLKATSAPPKSPVTTTTCDGGRRPLVTTCPDAST